MGVSVRHVRNQFCNEFSSKKARLDVNRVLIANGHPAVFEEGIGQITGKK
jgi:hypothetical protein